MKPTLMRRLFLYSYLHVLVMLVCVTLHGENEGVGYEAQFFS